MKLRSERGENGDFSGPKGEFKNRFLERRNATIDSRSSRLHEICGLAESTVGLVVGSTVGEMLTSSDLSSVDEPPGFLASTEQRILVS